MPTYTVSIIEATNTGHRIISSTGLHTQEEATSILNARLPEPLDYDTSSVMANLATASFKVSGTVVCLITRHGI